MSNNYKSESYDWVEEHFRMAFSIPDKKVPFVDATKRFIRRLPEKDQTMLEKLFGPDADTIEATREDAVWALTRLGKIERQYMENRASPLW